MLKWGVKEVINKRYLVRGGQGGVKGFSEDWVSKGTGKGSVGGGQEVRDLGCEWDGSV